jgi:hypothetical protein
MLITAYPRGGYFRAVRLERDRGRGHRAGACGDGRLIEARALGNDIGEYRKVFQCLLANESRDMRPCLWGQVGCSPRADFWIFGFTSTGWALTGNLAPTAFC